jgi:peptidoglycan hydrolase-like protein with peptidoglycan-binding domain
MSPVQIQSYLAQLKMYGGEIDGNVSTQLFREAVMVFQRAWDLDVDGDAGIMTQRTLAFVTATQQITPLAPLVA